ncbi:ABC transporter domain-containing protein [Rozella allomycis CSF55]|uniref:ABC transporter domain-containing protein n=1 Tax=Rozella allomycis (strain CSF55) TaxID=988480 RepID=A0A075ANQ7_ROZAC|nr:ABC transporter domain-containing protein [Rozella allomycis CSF55]|eukprot:EPZ31550.1 ABC transporter domain-containing protein [Rozella allomycis CSF55]
MSIDVQYQSTRFSITDNSSLVIDIQDLTLTVDNNTLLANANFQLPTNSHFALIGRNGLGKSIFMKILVDVFLLDSSLRVFHLQQIEDVLDLENISVTDYVIKGHEFAQNVIWEKMMLESSHKNLKQVLLKRHERKLRIARNKVTKISGARGKQERENLIQLERDYNDLFESDMTEEDLIIKTHELLQDIELEYQLLEPNNFLTKAKKILRGLGFPKSRLEDPYSSFSGGWKKRAALAQALFVEPDVLFLDEPTNGLDIKAIEWLENYLNSLVNVTILVVSHDREFLNSVAQGVILLRNKSFTSYDGNYDTFEETVLNKAKYMERMHDGIERKRIHMQKSIEKGMKQAKSKGDDKKLAAVASRKKKLEERLGFERNEKGHRFKLNRDRPGFHNSLRDDVELEEQDGSFEWCLPAPTHLKHAAPLVSLENVSFSYESNALLSKISLTIEMGTKVVLTGANGQGKSTLVDLIYGALKPKTGSISYHSDLKIGYVRQNQSSLQGMKMCPLELIHTKAPTWTEHQCRSHLASFTLKHPTVLHEISTLSGGQLTRLMLAVETISHPNLLLLDEPTNHLDMDSIQALIDALRQYSGAALIVTHDRKFISEMNAINCKIEKGSLLYLE